MTSKGLFDDDDDVLFGQPGPSKVGSLFEDDKPKSKESTSLSYQRVKQPKKTETVTTDVKKSIILYAGKLDLYDESTSKYNIAGVAIVENDKANNKFELIIYYTSTSYLTVVPIKKDFEIINQTRENTYFGSFYDNNRKSWSFRYHSVDDMERLGVNISIARYLDSGSSSQLVLNLYYPEKGYKIENEDKILVKVSSWVYKNSKVVEVGQKQDFVTYLGSPKNNKLWSEALVGMRKFTRRIVVFVDSGEVKAFSLSLEKIKKGGAVQKTPEEKQDSHPTSSSPVSDGKKEDLMQRVAKLGIQMPVLTSTNQEVEHSNKTEQSVSQPTTSQPTISQPTTSQPNVPPQHPQYPNPQPHVIPQNNDPYGNPYGQHPQHPSYTPYQHQPNMPISPGYNQMQNQYQSQPNNLYNPYQPSNPYQYTPPQPSNQLALTYPNPQSNFVYPNQQQMQHPQLPVQQQPINVIAQMPYIPEERYHKKEKKEEPKKEEKQMPITAETIQLLFEEKQLKSDIKVLLDKICDKLDEISTKLDNTIFTNSHEVLPGISGKMLLHSIERVVLENESMTNEVESRKLDELDLIDSDSDVSLE